MFPEDDYTPYGYLDNPFHCWKLHRSGVVRVSPPCGFGWFFPNAEKPIYHSCLNVGFEIDGRRFLLPGEAQDETIQLTCSYHSKNLFRFHLHGRGVSGQIEFFLADENVLTAEMKVESGADSSQNISLLLIQSVQLNFRKSGLWDFGLTGNFHARGNYATVKSFAEGYCFVLKPSLKCESFIFTNDPAQLKTKPFPVLAENDYCSTTQPDLYGLIKIPMFREQQNPLELKAIFTRGVSEKQALDLADSYSSKVAKIRIQKIEEDSQFWESCPRLAGDWLPHWKRGWVYDWETLRMNVRKPVGIFSRHWDAMQIQKPRIVLAETALDMLMLSYAKPELSKEVILGLFQDSLGAQVPCAREDGSLNMISEDGSECGTSPAWCFPFYCFQSILARNFDIAWLKKMVPHLGSYLNWWLENRTDAEGWGIYNCSWESGQDGSQKFLLQQQTGGEIVIHVRSVDLQAAMAQSAKIMSGFAHILNANSRRWDNLEQDYIQKTKSMWQENWFCDFDKRSNAWIKNDRYRDITNLAPFFAGIFDDEQLQKAPELFLYFVENPKIWLEWASFFFMYIEACWRVELQKLMSSLLFNTIDRVYQNWDRREWRNDEPMPGISVECWGLEKPLGAEGYGWAATLPLHIIRSLVGFRETENQHPSSFLLCPNLPDQMMIPGKIYELNKLKFQDKIFSLQYQIFSHDEIKCHFAIHAPAEFDIKVMTGDDQLLVGSKNKASRHQININFENQKNYKIILG